MHVRGCNRNNGIADNGSWTLSLLTDNVVKGLSTSIYFRTIACMSWRTSTCRLLSSWWCLEATMPHRWMASSSGQLSRSTSSRNSIKVLRSYTKKKEVSFRCWWQQKNPQICMPAQDCRWIWSVPTRTLIDCMELQFMSAVWFTSRNNDLYCRLEDSFRILQQCLIRH